MISAERFSGLMAGSTTARSSLSAGRKRDGERLLSDLKLREGTREVEIRNGLWHVLGAFGLREAKPVLRETKNLRRCSSPDS
jgi:hypothetical protein